MAASASDAHPFPIFNARFRFIAPLLDADGDLVTGATTPDSEISQDCGTFADATNEMTEIATSSGMYYLDLIATEMDTKSTAVIMKSATAGMKTTPVVLYPVRLPVIRTGTAQAGGASSITLDSGASAIDDYYVGCYVNITNNSPANALGQARLITAYVGSTKVATVEGTYGTNPSSASTFEILATDRWVYRFADTRAFSGTAGTFSSGRPEVNTTHVAGTSQTARDLGAQLDAAVSTRLAPTTAGRTLDVTATGEAGIDWANIGGPTTVVNLSGTTVKTATDVETDTQDIQSRLPAALVSGRIDASIGAVAANAITAAGIADGAIDRATFAVDTGLQTVRSNTATSGAVSGITLDVSASATDDFYNGCVIVLTGGTGVGQARVIVDYFGGTKVATVDRNWATNPDNTTTFAILGSSAPKLNSSIEVISASVTGAVGSVTGAVGSVTGNVGGNVVGSVGSVTGAVGSVTGNVGGNVTGSVGSVAAGGITAASLAADAITAAKIADGAIDAATFAAGAINAAAIATDAITAGKIAADAIGASELAADAVAEIADAVWDELQSGHTTAGTFGKFLDAPVSGATAPTAAQVADAVWDETLSDHLTAGSTGAGLNAAGSAGDPWGTALPGAYGAGTAGKIVGDNLNATVSSRATQTSVDTIDDFVDTEVAAIKAKTDQLTFTTANKVDSTIQAAGDFAQGAADKVWSTATRALTDKVGFALSSAGIQAIWDALTSALTTVGSIGKLLVDNINATISSRLASGTVAADVTAIKAKTDNLPASPAATGDIPSAAAVATQVRTELTTELGRVDATVSTRATPAQVNTEVLDVLTVDTFAEPASVPAATSTLKDKLAWLFTLGRNKVTQTATTQAVRDDADTVDVATAGVSDDGTTFTRDEWQ